MRTIVIATDLSGRADRAMARGMQLAGQHGANVNLLCVLDEDLPANFLEALERDARRHLGEAAAEAERLGLRATQTLVAGRPPAEILRAAQRSEADLVVLGTHRDDKFSDMLLGTTVERVIRHGDAPVLVVRDRPAGPYRDVVVAVDFSLCSRFALNFALRAAPEAGFRLLHAYETPFPAFLSSDEDARQWREERRSAFQSFVEEELQKMAGEAAARTRIILAKGDVIGEISREVAAQKPDLLVLGTHGRSGLGQAVIGSVARGFLCAPPCDVLAVKAG